MKKISLILLMSLFCQYIYAEKFIIYTSEGGGFYKQHKIKKALDEIFTRSGLDYVYENIPADRAIDNLSHGIGDADMGRIKEIGMKYPELIVVREPYRDVKFCGLYINERVMDKPFNERTVGYVGGWFIIGERLKSEKTKNIIEAKDLKHLILLLRNNRIDYAVFERETIEMLLKTKEYDDIKKDEEFQIKSSLHIILSKKNSKLEPEICEIIKEMKREGKID